MANIYDFEVKGIDGKPVKLAEYKGKVMLIVNVASKCGFTPQYEGLEKLWRSHKDKGLVILGFPCNQFGAQEPGDAAEIQNFCKLSYDVTFPMFAKIDVNGENTDPLYAFLKKEEKGILGTEGIKWNFTKFVIDRQGNVIKRYAPNATPDKIGEELLAGPLK
jgi:glutathione peroxidase